ncbi:hypothetical protein B5S32_g4131 [[Candida] boidinii]|nr:hypothetical protein B5S32_g4131 [[Candida] boidinii]
MLNQPHLLKYDQSHYYKETFNDIQTCLPKIILHGDDSRLINCSLGPEHADLDSLVFEPIDAYSTLEDKYRAIISLQDQLICRFFSFEYWWSLLSIFDCNIIEYNPENFVDITDDRWAQCIIKLFHFHSIKSERIDYIQFLLTEEPLPNIDLYTWMLTFIDRIEECGTEDNFNNVRNRITRILIKRRILFLPSEICSIKSYEILRGYIKKLHIPLLYSKVKIQKFKKNGINSKVKAPNNK